MFMRNNEALLQSLEGKTDDEKRAILRKNYKNHYNRFEGCCKTFYENNKQPCKFWWAQVFDYCNSSELQSELDCFFFLINLFAHLFGFCFNLENTVYLGCTCPCGRNQVILYYSISFDCD